MATMESPEGQALRALFARLVPYKVLEWSSSSSDKDTDRVAVPLDQADVVSSVIAGTATTQGARHAVVLDIDHPTWLVKSSTPGHYHLYIDVPGGIEHDNYVALLNNLAYCGVIENGYRNASKARGFSCARLPWVKKPLPVPRP